MQLSKLGPYRIGKPVGKGGMGSVYEATDTQTDQRVAVKALNPHLAHAEGFRERFEAEIESLKTLRHDGIVRLYGYGEQDGVLFYSMEIVVGTSLEDELKAGRRFNWREVSDIAIQLCMSLKHAHDHGIIHRDIKPANILITEAGQVKLADFGIARLFANSSSLTTAGGVLGTADYMSPEQADGRPVSARCDQYSLGGVMYALLAGRPPFRAKNLPEMLQLQRFAEAEPVSRYAPDTPKQMERVITQLLAKDPAARFPNMQVLARHLQAMVMALSRPTHDTFSLAGDAGHEAADNPLLDSSIALAVTQAETDSPSAVAGTPPPANGRRPSLIEEAKPAPLGTATVPADKDVDPPGPKSGPMPGVPTAAPKPGVSVFTTVDEEEARAQQHARPWLAALGPFATLLIAVAAIAALAIHFMQPLTADQLYGKIAAHTDADDSVAVREVEREIREFTQRFPDDSRAAEILQHRQRIDLDIMNRKLQLRARKGGVVDSSLLPCEVLYLQAMNTAQTSPDATVSKLLSLIQLYGADVPAEASDAPEVAVSRASDDSNARRILCVQLARRQLDLIRGDVAKLNERQRADIRDRIAAADALAANNPEQARAMLQAIVELYGGEPWAADVVGEAKSHLKNIKPVKSPAHD